ncbi:MAG: DUF5916 domain-containing protein [Bacteroidota bacterium]
MIAAAMLVMALATDTGSTATPEVQALRVAEPIVVDGKLDDAEWESVPVFTRFVQRDPIEGASPSMRTEVRIAYDDDAIYIAARMFDPAADSITVRLGRRDVQQNADLFQVYLDTYHDRRSGYYFGVDAAGTMYDGILYNDDWNDDSWDGVWEAKVRRDGSGWTAELRIPFSQLRFQDQQSYRWGINFQRDIARRSETDWITFTPKNGSGFVSRFATLTGIGEITPPRRIELLPYLTTRAEYLQHPSGDPFNNGARYTPRVGLDVKMGLGSNLTLDGTVNPDFGQVEVDPAVVNLGDVETYFNEKRPFFIEGSSTFNFGRGGAVSYWGFNWSDPQFFYSRRIGRAPEGALPQADFADVPSGTAILGAAKLTGKAGQGWNIGAIEAVTGREHADIQLSGNRSRLEVEPLTSYTIARVQKEFSEGGQGLGAMATMTSRFFDESSLRDQLNSGSNVAGLDGWTFLDSSRTWVLTGWGSGSFARGSSDRMIALQSNAQHYRQRPDALHARIDSSATSVSGYAGRLMLSKQKGNSFVNSAIGVISPDFDINDLGFLWRADVVNMHAVAGYQWTSPTSWYRSIVTGTALFRTLNFDGITTWEGIYSYATYQFLNYYTFRFDWAYNPQTSNDRRTRGGPLTLNPKGYQIDWEIQTDPRKDIVGDVSFFFYRDREATWSLSASIDAHPLPNLEISVGPEIDKNSDYAQWVGAFADPAATATYGTRYMFALLDQTTLSANIRINWTFTPHLSLQLYLQPLISSASYRDFRSLVRPGSYDFLTYGTNGSTVSNNGGNVVADPDGNGPVASIGFPDPSFLFSSLRGNAVLRWEYLPGSTLYLVWTQTRSESDQWENILFRSSVRRLVNIRPDNIFMAKLTYWWNR